MNTNSFGSVFFVTLVWIGFASGFFSSFGLTSIIGFDFTEEKETVGSSIENDWFSSQVFPITKKEDILLSDNSSLFYLPLFDVTIGFFSSSLFSNDSEEA